MSDGVTSFLYLGFCCITNVAFWCCYCWLLLLLIVVIIIIAATASITQDIPSFFQPSYCVNWYLPVCG